jgi:hypothetical protein
MIQYFQLTPDILLEYIYEGDPKLDEDNIEGNKKDIYDDESATMLLKSNAFSSKYLCFKNETEGLDSFSNLVLPLNNTETQFVVAKSKYQNFFSKVNVSNRYLTNGGGEYIYEDTNYDVNIKNSGESCNVKYDKCIIHFTSRNYFGSYDALIFQAYAYMTNKAKLYFASFLFKKTSNLELKAEHLLYNEKLYTTQIEFDIPSVYAIFNKDSESDKFIDALKAQNIEMLENTPIAINVYGVSGITTGTDNYIRLKTLKINTVSIPYIYNRLDEIHVNISESVDGDFYYIEPKMSESCPSFVDYIERMGEDIRAYMVMHELYLREVWVDDDSHTHSEITHKEFHIIDINEQDEDSDIISRFNAKIKYRPICMYGGKDYVATIIDTIKIINTVDSSSYEVTGSIEISNPNKYGMKLKRLGIKNESRPIVNVYNKKVTKGTGTPGYGYSVGTGFGSGSGGTGSGSGGSGSGSGGTGSGSGGTGSGSGGTGSGSGGTGSGSGGTGSGSGLGKGPISGSFSGSFSMSGSGSGGSGSGSGSVSGSFSGSITGFGDISGNITGSLSEDGSNTLSGTVTGIIAGVGNLTGTLSGSDDGTITGEISGYIPGSGSFTGYINGYLAGDGVGYITGSFAGPGSSSGSGTGSGFASTSNNGTGSSNVVVVNKGGGFIVENLTQNIVSFIECTNVGVSIVELSPEDIN